MASKAMRLSVFVVWMTQQQLYRLAPKTEELKETFAQWLVGLTS